MGSAEGSDSGSGSSIKSSGSKLDAKVKTVVNNIEKLMRDADSRNRDLEIWTTEIERVKKAASSGEKLEPVSQLSQLDGWTTEVDFQQLDGVDSHGPVTVGENGINGGGVDSHVPVVVGSDASDGGGVDSHVPMTVGEDESTGGELAIGDVEGMIDQLHELPEIQRPPGLMATSSGATASAGRMLGGPNVEGWEKHGRRGNRFITWSQGNRSGKVALYTNEVEHNFLECEEVDDREIGNGEELVGIADECIGVTESGTKLMISVVDDEHGTFFDGETFFDCEIWVDGGTFFDGEIFFECDIWEDEDDIVAGVEDDGDGEWKKVRVTLDSGATIDIMPEEMLQHIKVGRCTGARRGRKLVAANNTPIEATGEKRIEAVTEGGAEVDWRFISGGVKKILKSIATTCDDNNWVIFTNKGGWIIDTRTKERIAFERIGNSYALDLWVWVPKNDEKEWKTIGKGGKPVKNGFSGPSKN